MSEIDREIVRRVVRGVLEEMAGRSDGAQGVRTGAGKEEPGMRVLFLFNAGVRKLDDALEQVRLIEESGVKSGVYTGPSARGWVCGDDVRGTTGARCILDTVKPEGVEKVLQLADVLVLPTLCLTVAAKVAGLVCDDQESRLVLSALMQGKRVLAARDGFLVCDVLLNERLRGEIEGVLGKLEEFGVVFSPTHLLNRIFQERMRSEKTKGTQETVSGDAGSEANAFRLITGKQITDAVADRTHTVVLAPGGMITPLARDLAKEYAVNIVKR
jgi:hypothetical protein